MAHGLSGYEKRWQQGKQGSPVVLLPSHVLQFCQIDPEALPAQVGHRDSCSNQMLKPPGFFIIPSVVNKTPRHLNPLTLSLNGAFHYFLAEYQSLRLGSADSDSKTSHTQPDCSGEVSFIPINQHLILTAWADCLSFSQVAKNSEGSFA